MSAHDLRKVHSNVQSTLTAFRHVSQKDTTSVYNNHDHVYLYTCMYQLGSPQTDLHEIWQWRVFLLDSDEKIQLRLKSDKYITYFK
jgi:hypothetical protein